MVNREIVCHSYLCPMACSFLHHVTYLLWKRQHFYYDKYLLDKIMFFACEWCMIESGLMCVYTSWSLA